MENIHVYPMISRVSIRSSTGFSNHPQYHFLVGRKRWASHDSHMQHIMCLYIYIYLWVYVYVHINHMHRYMLDMVMECHGMDGISICPSPCIFPAIWLDAKSREYMWWLMMIQWWLYIYIYIYADLSWWFMMINICMCIYTYIIYVIYTVHCTL